MSDAAQPRAPRGRLIWGGFCLSAWLRLLARNGFAVEAPFRGAAAMATVLSSVSSLLGAWQTIRYGAAIRRTVIPEAPVFILGHWRSGTTFLFDLLARDERFGYPDTYECFFPGHFLVSRNFVTSRVRLEGDRGVDRVRLGWEQPREDEFALCALGLPSPYLTAAFPNRPPQCSEYLDLRSLSEAQRRAWMKRYQRFLQALTLHKQKRLMLKCPPHTARVRVLQRMFPSAQFIHIVRDPLAVIPSTLKLWRTVFDGLGLQTPTYAGLEDYVFDNFRRVTTCLDEDRPQLPAAQFYELRYEDLVADPLRALETIYQRLGLGDFAARRAALESYLATLKDYQPNKHDVQAELCSRIERECGAFMRRYGYLPAGNQEADAASIGS
ncbi:hypothetical protein AYO44_05805 [Planctomycetaceae bacterium SCGC AG-212-F19]|nr:hypothetical protein AYO44_05805 [Planctomycetaceae bacterium SCGC AG-212-F19]